MKKDNIPYHYLTPKYFYLHIMNPFGSNYNAQGKSGPKFLAVVISHKLPEASPSDILQDSIRARLLGEIRFCYNK